MKILIFMKNWIGDALFQFPAIEMIRARYPEAKIVCVAPARCREILEAHPAVDGVRIYDEKKEHRFFLKRLKFGWDLRKEKWDQGVLFHRSRTRAFLFWLGGVGERIGYGFDRRFFLTKAVAEPAAALHHVDYFVEMLAQAGYNRPALPAYRFYFPEACRERIAEILRDKGLNRFVCFHLGANWPLKRWPAGHFAELAVKIRREWGLQVVLTGSQDDRVLGEEVLSAAAQAGVLSLIGETNLGELAALFERAVFTVSADSGPMHIASGVGTRVVAIFGPTDPALTGPRGIGESVVVSYVPPGCSLPWYGREVPEGGWMSRICPNDVFHAVEKRGWHRLPQPPRPRPPEMTGRKSGGGRTAMSATPVEKILFVTLSNVGDVVLTTPALMTLVAEYPAAKLTVVAGPRAESLLAGSRYIHRLVVYDKRASWIRQWFFLKKLREESYDLVVDLRNTAIPYLVRAKQRSPLFRRLKAVSFRERHLEVLAAMGIRGTGIPVFDFYDEISETHLLKKLRLHGIASDRGWILVAPVAASQLKTWRLDGFRKVIGKLLEERPGEILLIGDKRERGIAAELVSVDPERVFNLAGETTLREAAALVSRASLLVANDSAMMHLAYEVGCPVVAVFGPTSMPKYGHEGPKFCGVRANFSCIPCEEPVCRLERRVCLDDLAAERVLEACRKFTHAYSV